MSVKGHTFVILAFLFVIGSGLAYGQAQDSYRGFRIGMVLSETFAVGGGNLEKAQAACATPPKQLSDQERELLTKVCSKMERTLSGQPTEWEFPKEQLRIAFDHGHIIRVSDFDGVIHLQESQPQIATAASNPVPSTPISLQQPTTSAPPMPSRDQDVAAAAAANKAAKGKAAATQQALASTEAPVPAVKTVAPATHTVPVLPDHPTFEQVLSYSQAASSSGHGDDPQPPAMRGENLSPAFARAASKAVLQLSIGNVSDADPWLAAADDLSDPGATVELDSLVALRHIELDIYQRNLVGKEYDKPDCIKGMFAQFQIRHFYSVPITCSQ